MSEQSPALPAVAVDGVTKWFGELTALDRVDVAVATGTVHGLVGPNGAGKSTLLALLFGLLRADEGEVRLFGRTRRDAGSAWLDGVGGFIESPRFYPYLSGRANLAVLARLDRDDSQSLIDEVLDLVGLGAARTQKVKGYSLGMRQRLGLAAAIIRRPRLVLLDEPTNGMDPAGIASLRAALRSLGGRGVTVLFSSHDIAQVDDLCDAVTVLDRGAVVFSGTAQQLRERAPDAVWRLRTSDDRVAARTATEQGVRLLEPGADGALRLRAGTASLDELMFALHRDGVAVRQLGEAMSALESLMAELTDASRAPASDTAVDGDAAVAAVGGRR